MLKSFLEENNIVYESNVSLKKKTWIKTGGTASLWIEPNTVEALEKLLSYIYVNNIEFEVVGHTSNIYYVNSYDPKNIISTSKIKSFRENDSFIECDCGAPISRVSRYAVDMGYEGFSGLVNLPGTVAAAVCNNSSCFSCDIASLVHSFRFFDLSTGKIVEMSAFDMAYSFRSSALKRKDIQGVILSVKLIIRKGDISAEKLKSEEATCIRKATQEPPAYTLGSVFAGLEFKPAKRLRLASWGGHLVGNHQVSRIKLKNKLILLLYGYWDLQKYVSKKNINTFKWLPSDKNHIDKFNKYVEFINKISINPKLEIEIRRMDDNRD